MIRSARLAFLLLLLTASAGTAQLPTIRGFYQNVPLWSDSTAFANGGLSDFNRLRLMTAPRLGDFTLQIAYEQFLSLSQRPRLAPSPAFGALLPSGGEWLDLQWTIEETDHVFWGHRFDRLNIRWLPNPLLDITVGRQAISWATTLLLTPADPFSPFDPSDPFRQYRAGVDAARVQVYTGPLTDFDIVARPTKNPTLSGTEVEELTVLGRGRTVWKTWEVSAWLGMIYEEPGLAVSTAGSIGAFALRGEASLREREDDVVIRATVDIDRLFRLLGRDLYVVLEYQHDGFGASSPEAYTDVVTSAPFARGELQVLGQDELVGQASWQVHPLWNTSLLLLWNLNDGSAQLVPGASYSLSNEVRLQSGVFLGFGDSTPTTATPIPSEYGISPTSVYAALNAFF